jgi:hypothetical protein
MRCVGRVLPRFDQRTAHSATASVIDDYISSKEQTTTVTRDERDSDNWTTRRRGTRLMREGIESVIQDICIWLLWRE